MYTETESIIWASLNPLGTVDGHSRGLREATGPGDVHSRIPTRTHIIDYPAVCAGDFAVNINLQEG